jgi:5-methylcytosine-specific restriction endonuclease McrA
MSRRKTKKVTSVWVLSIEGAPIATFTKKPSQREQDRHIAMYIHDKRSPVSDIETLRKIATLNLVRLFRPSGNGQRYIRKEIYDLYFVLGRMLRALRGKKNTILFGEDRIKVQSHRYRCFVYNGVTCTWCGLVGKFFAKETHHAIPKNQNGTINKYHLNLYALDGNGNEVLMTKDHIIPRSKGGSNHHENLQTMCSRCNGLKDDKE